LAAARLSAALRLSLALALAACASQSHGSRPRIEKPVDLPEHVYHVPPEPGRLVVDAASFAELAKQMRADLERDLSDYDIRDNVIVKDHLFHLAILDALDGKWSESTARLDRASALEDNPALRHMMGLTIRVWAAAVQAGHDDATGFREALEKKLAAMPIDVVREELRQLVTIANLVTPQFCQNIIDLQMGQVARQKGTVTLDAAEGILFQRWLYLRLIPVAPAIPEVVSRAMQPPPSPAP
jgi:hypothetical protein